MWVESPYDTLQLNVWDKDLTTVDAVGFTLVKLSSLILNNGVEDWFTIFFDNKPAGKVLLKTKFEPEGGDALKELKANITK